MATKITLPQSIVLRTPIREKRSDENSTAWAKTGTRVSHLQVEIDPELLVRRVGVRAVNSKKGISKLQHGAIVVRVISSVAEAQTQTTKGD